MPKPSDYISKSQTMTQPIVSRRSVLRAAGISLALPWFESAAWGDAQDRGATPPKRFCAMYFPYGVAVPGPSTKMPIGIGFRTNLGVIFSFDDRLMFWKAFAIKSRWSEDCRIRLSARSVVTIAATRF